jgi:hypothetical protein
MKAMHGFQAVIAQVLVRYGEVPTGAMRSGQRRRIWAEVNQRWREHVAVRALSAES